MRLPVAILAGGLATRLHPLTEAIPKALVDVAGEPFIVRQLRQLKGQGYRRVVLCVGFLGDQVKEFLGDGSTFGLDLYYSQDWPVLRGTGGALKQALPILGDRFLVLYGDSYLPINFAAVEQAFLDSGRLALMTVLRNSNRWDKSNVLFQDGRIAEYNKRAPQPAMAHIDYGLGALSASIFENETDVMPLDLADIYQDLARRGELTGFEVQNRFYEIGSHGGLRETTAYFEKENFNMSYAQQHLRETIGVIAKIDVAAVEKMADLLAQVKAEGGRLFFLGVGGSAGNCSHAVNDFRKIAGIESYAPTDNVSELTARTNDEGWATVFIEWLKISKLQSKDALFIFSVGGGNLERNISPNLVAALQFAHELKAKILGVVGRDGGYTAQVADACVIVPTVNPENITPHSEAFQAVIWHLLVSHPKLKANETKWESAVKAGKPA